MMKRLWLALLLFGALAGLPNCSGSNVVGGRDGDTPDASADRPTTPAEDRPPATSDASDDTVADVTPASDGGPEAAVDASQHEDVAPDNTAPPPDAGPTMCEAGRAPMDRCSPRIDPRMTRSAFACGRTCDPTTLQLFRGSMHQEITVTCFPDEVYGVVYANLTEIMTPGTYPCVDHACVRYIGPTEATIALIWDDACESSAVYRCAPGVIPSIAACDLMSDMPQVSVSRM